MSNIKNQPVHRGIINPMQSDSQLHCTQIGGEMSAGLGDILNLKFPEFLTQRNKLVTGQAFNIVGTVYSIYNTQNYTPIGRV
jgi:hypothetical protein